MPLPIIFYTFTSIILKDRQFSVKSQLSNFQSIGSAPEIYFEVYPTAEL